MNVVTAVDAGAAVREIHVNVAEVAVAQGTGLLTTCGLGSCVAIALFDAASQIGGLAHILLPGADRSRPSDRAAKYAETAVPFLLAEMRHAGSRATPVAKIAGGASMFGALLGNSGVNMGERNVDATRNALVRAGVPIIGEDVGGEHGRSIYFDVATGAVRVHSLRRGDRWL
ncbi:MAG TPA: chemotaxis protein CheD [Solirubrobacteraceae bacterium]